jgi:hypothetical protein
MNIFKIKRKDGTFCIIALQFNDFNSIRLVVLKGSNPYYNEVFSIIFSYTNIVERITKEKLKRVFHSKVCRHNGMSASYLWIEYGQMKKKEPDDFTDYSFKDIITGIQRTKKLQISGSNKLDGFTFYILDLIDFAIELNVLKFENGVVSKGRNYIEVDVDIIGDKTSSFISADTKNKIYQALIEWEIKTTIEPIGKTESETVEDKPELYKSVSEYVIDVVTAEQQIKDEIRNNEVFKLSISPDVLVGDFLTCNMCSKDIIEFNDKNQTQNKIYFNNYGVALNGEDTTEYDNKDETVFSDIKEHGLTQREILLCDEYSENLNEINESHLPPSYIEYIIEKCIKDIDKHTECYEEDITFLKKCNIPKYNEQIKAIIEKNDEIKNEISETINNIIESDMREDDIVRSMIEDYTEVTPKDETPSNILKITLNN